VGEDGGADVLDVALGGERVGQEHADEIDAVVEHQLGLLAQVGGTAVHAPVVDELLGDEGLVRRVETAQVFRPDVEVVRLVGGVRVAEVGHRRLGGGLDDGLAQLVDVLVHEAGVGDAGRDRAGAEAVGDAVLPRLAVAQLVEPGERDELDRPLGPPGLGHGLVEFPPDEADHVGLGAEAIDNRVSEGGGSLEPLRAAGSHPHRDVADVVPKSVGVQELHLGLLTEPAVDDALAPEQSTADLHRVHEFLDRRGTVAHRSQRVVGGADTEEGAARRQHVQGCDGIRGHRGDPSQRIGDHGAEMDRRRLLRRQGHLLIRVGEQQWPLAHTEVRHSEVFGLFDQIDLVDLGACADTELHVGFLLSV
jgi:hypothetical protein